MPVVELGTTCHLRRAEDIHTESEFGGKAGRVGIDGDDVNRGGVGLNVHALDSGKRNRQVEVVMSCLRVGDGNAIEADDDLVKGASPNGDIRLGTVGSTCADIYSGNGSKDLCDSRLLCGDSTGGKVCGGGWSDFDFR